MAIEEVSVKRPNAEDPSTILFYPDIVRRDPGPAPAAYRLERGDDLSFDDYTVPTTDYTSAEFHRLEVERLWPRTWLAVCRQNDIPDVGDYLEFSIAGRSILVVRDEQDSVVAFYNACRHRGCALAMGCGTAEAFICPFHGWRYALDGTLENVPAHWDFPDVTQTTTLNPVLVDSFDGWVYINMDPNADPLQDYIGETVWRHFSVYPNNNMWKQWHYGVVVAANWKVMAEAFFESYHIPRTHPTTVSFGPDLQTIYDAWGLHHRLSYPLNVGCLIGGGEHSEQEIFDAAIGFTAGRVPSTSERLAARIELPPGVTARHHGAEMIRQQMRANGIELSQVSDTDILDTPLYFLFPNWMTFKGPAGNQGYRFRPYGDDPNVSLFEVFQLVPVPDESGLPKDAPLEILPPGEKLEHYAETHGLGQLGYLLDQDLSNAPLVQTGLPGTDRIICGREQEKLIVHFHHNLRQFMTVEERRPSDLEGER